MILYNNQNPYTIALLVPNKEYLKKEVADLASETGKEEAIRIISRDINKFKKGGELYGMFPERWLPATFAVLPEAFTEQNGMVNSTMKVVRGKVEKTYANRIDALYTSEGKDPLNNENKQSL